MLSNVLTTPVDDMVDIIKDNPNCSVVFLSEKLNLPVEILERWLVVLEEFKVVEILYKGFNGYVKVSNSILEKEKGEILDLSNLKQSFVEKSKEKGFSVEKLQEVWPEFISSHESEIKSLFENKAKAQGYKTEKIKLAWDKYRTELGRL